MLAVTSYSTEHVANARKLISDQLAAYASLSSTNDFDIHFFRNLVLMLDRCFVHRMRGAEGKDGNPLNEMRMICDSVVNNDGVLAADKSIKYQPENARAGLAVGDQVMLDRASFEALAEGVFSEIDRRFPPPSDD
jgi:hypothetical protein